MSQTMFQQIRNNKIKSIVILSLFVILIGILGALIGIVYNNLFVGLILSIIAALIYMTLAYRSGKSMILNMTGAKPVTKKDYPHLFHTIEGLSVAAGIPKPKAYIINDSALNAFATGSNPKDSAVVVTTGLLEKLNRQELEGVIAHEISHIRNYDIRVMLLATVLVGIAVLLSDFLLRSFLFGAGRGRRDSGNIGLLLIAVGLILAILTPFIGEMIRLAVSRKREFLADASGAQLTRYPPGLANALEKISKDPDPLVDNANKATAHLFISTPFRKRKGFLVKLFATHPPIKERIKRLKDM